MSLCLFVLLGRMNPELDERSGSFFFALQAISFVPEIRLYRFSFRAGSIEVTEMRRDKPNSVGLDGVVHFTRAGTAIVWRLVEVQWYLSLP